MQKIRYRAPINLYFLFLVYALDCIVVPSLGSPLTPTDQSHIFCRRGLINSVLCFKGQPIRCRRFGTEGILFSGLRTGLHCRSCKALTLPSLGSPHTYQSVAYPPLSPRADQLGLLAYSLLRAPIRRQRVLTMIFTGVSGSIPNNSNFQALFHDG